jgi:hypothetical protein
MTIKADGRNHIRQEIYGIYTQKIQSQLFSLVFSLNNSSVLTSFLLHLLSNLNKVSPRKFTHALHRHKYISYASVCACCSVLCGYHFDSIHWAPMCTQQRNFTLSMCFWNKCQINQFSKFISAGWIYYCIIYSLSFSTHILWVDRWLSANRILNF